MGLTGYVLRRLGLLLVTLVAISLLISGVLELLPGDAAEQILGAWAERSGQTLAAMRVRLGLDRPWHERYLTWLGGAVRGDLGRSLALNQPIAPLLLERLLGQLNRLQRVARRFGCDHAHPGQRVGDRWRVCGDGLKGVGAHLSMERRNAKLQGHATSVVPRPCVAAAKLNRPVVLGQRLPPKSLPGQRRGPLLAERDVVGGRQQQVVHVREGAKPVLLPLTARDLAPMPSRRALVGRVEIFDRLPRRAVVVELLARLAQCNVVVEKILGSDAGHRYSPLVVESLADCRRSIS